MIELEEYKNYLINTYRKEIDNTKEKRQERKEILDKKYSDEYLLKIITDTYNVIKSIMDLENITHYEIELDTHFVSLISLKLTGGYFSDLIYHDTNGNIISEYILNKTFGENFLSELRIEQYEIKDKNTKKSSYGYENSLYMKNFPNNMKEIKIELFGLNKVKKKG